MERQVCGTLNAALTQRATDLPEAKEFHGRDDPGVLPDFWKVTDISRDKVVGFRGLSALQKSVILFLHSPIQDEGRGDWFSVSSNRGHGPPGVARFDPKARIREYPLVLGEYRLADK
jgi:hypothetical protein